MKRPGEEWLERATIDVRTIERVIDDPTLTPAAAFHSQQCIEKCFKAILEAHASDVPRTHDLVLLYGRIGKFTSIRIDEHILTMVNETYIETRYPTMSSDDEMNIPSLKTMNLFFDEAKHIYQSVRVLILDIPKED